MFHKLAYIPKLPLSWRVYYIIPFLYIFFGFSISQFKSLSYSEHNNVPQCGSFLVLNSNLLPFCLRFHCPIITKYFFPWMQGKTVSCLCLYFCSAFIICLISIPTFWFHTTNSYVSCNSSSDLLLLGLWTIFYAP